jgi:hypothetical protein
MMVKNEQKRILVSLNSVVGVVDAIIIYDTGSEDNTIELIEKFCEEKKINLYLKKGVFTDFATSRNESLEFADTVNVKYFLLLDCNDEIRGGDSLKILANTYVNEKIICFMICQQWWYGKTDTYYNMRFIKARSGLRYKGSVHEWLYDSLSETTAQRFPVIKVPNTIYIYQDRTQDDDKSHKRLKRDKELLLRDYKNNKEISRTLFYLAQTCECLNLWDEAMYYSKLRLEYQDFKEERYHSFIRIGDCSLRLEHDWCEVMKWYVKAFEEFNRAEPLIKIADYYRNKAFSLKLENKESFNYWNIAYMYAKQACDINYPDHCLLFVDKELYEYYRWHVLGVISYYCEKIEEGKNACLKAVKCKNDEIDKINLKFYLDYEKNKFFIEKNEQLKKNGIISEEQRQNIIKKSWKKKKKTTYDQIVQAE